MRFIQALAPALIAALALAAGPVQAEVITCTFFEKEEGRTVQVTLQGDPAAGDPAWQAVVLSMASDHAQLRTGKWVGTAEDSPDHRLSEITFNLFQWNGQSGLGVSVVAGPALDGVAYGMKQFAREPDGSIAPEPVWGKLRIDDKLVMSQPMEVYDHFGAGLFLRMTSGFLNLPGSDVPYGVDAETEANLNALLKSKTKVTFDLYPFFTADRVEPSPLTPSLVSFEFDPASFVTGQASAQKHWADALAQYAAGCPDNRYVQ